MNVHVQLRGARELAADVEAVQGALAKGVEALLPDLAAQTAKGARVKAGRDSLTGRAADSIRSQGPDIVAGGGVPWYGFADFGGSVGRRKSVKRRYIKGGRWFFPALQQLEVGKQAHGAVDEATKRLR